MSGTKNDETKEVVGTVLLVLFMVPMVVSQALVLAWATVTLWGWFGPWPALPAPQVAGIFLAANVAWTAVVPMRINEDEPPSKVFMRWAVKMLSAPVSVLCGWVLRAVAF